MDNWKKDWKKIVLVIKKENLCSEKPDRQDFINAWYRFANEREFEPFDFQVYGLKTKSKEFKKTWHITVCYKKRRINEYWRIYED